MKIALLVLPCLLCACGAETLGTAATTAKLQAEQVKQGQQDMEKLKTNLDTGAAVAERRAGDEASRN